MIHSAVSEIRTDAPGTLPDRVRSTAAGVERHPCFSEDRRARLRSGRLHLPVSPTCNILCAFCKRDFNATSQRPGVARSLLTPQAAAAMVGRALNLCPEIAVVGIAGPGDTLATDHALETFALIHGRFPNLINCLSTNGLLLPEKADRVIAVGVRTVTVTVNAVDPDIAAAIVAGVRWNGRWLKGREGTERLIANQLEGIRAVAAAGVAVKVNTVLVPGINHGHIAAIARETAAAGASLFNIIPLIPQHRLADRPAPSSADIAQARAQAEPFQSVFSHCQRCRADACGVPGKSEFSGRLYGEQARLSQPMTFSHG